MVMKDIKLKGMECTCTQCAIIIQIVKDILKNFPNKERNEVSPVVLCVQKSKQKLADPVTINFRPYDPSRGMMKKEAGTRVTGHAPSCHFFVLDRY